MAQSGALSSAPEACLEPMMIQVSSGTVHGTAQHSATSHSATAHCQHELSGNVHSQVSTMHAWMLLLAGITSADNLILSQQSKVAAVQATLKHHCCNLLVLNQACA
jgi:hypothetical protein